MKKYISIVVIGMLICSLAGCGVSTDSDSGADIKELEQRIEELEAENEELKTALKEFNEDENEPEISVIKEQETWDDDYSFPMTDKELSSDIRGCIDIWDRDVTYGDVKNIKTLKNGLGDRYSDVSALKYLTALEELDIHVTDDLTDISAFENLWNLETLKLRSCGGIKDLSALGNAKNLTTLYINGADSLTDISTLSELTALKDVEIIADNWQSLNLSVLLKLENLERLYISSGYSTGGIDADGNEIHIHVESVNLNNLQEWVDTH